MFFTGNYLMAKSNYERFNHLQNGFGYIEVWICFGVEVCLYHEIKCIVLLDNEHMSLHWLNLPLSTIISRRISWKRLFFASMTKIWRSLFSKPIHSGSGKSGGYLSVPTNIRQNKIDVFLKRWSSWQWYHHFGYQNVSKTVGGSAGSLIWLPSN